MSETPRERRSGADRRIEDTESHCIGNSRSGNKRRADPSGLDFDALADRVVVQTEHLNNPRGAIATILRRALLPAPEPTAPAGAGLDLEAIRERLDSESEVGRSTYALTAIPLLIAEIERLRAALRTPASRVAEELVDGLIPPKSRESTEAVVSAQEREYLAAGMKINAVRHYRERCGVSLRTAKDAIDAYQARCAPLEQPHVSQVAERRPGTPVEGEEPIILHRRRDPNGYFDQYGYEWWMPVEGDRPAGELLKRIREWDHLDTAADGPFWRREIDRVLAQVEPEPTDRGEKE